MRKFLTPEFLIGLSFFQLFEPAPVDFVFIIFLFFQFSSKRNLNVIILTTILTIPTFLFDLFNYTNFKWLLSDLLMVLYFYYSYLHYKYNKHISLNNFIIGLICSLILSLPFLSEWFLGFRFKFGTQDPNVLGGLAFISLLILTYIPSTRLSRKKTIFISFLLFALSIMSLSRISIFCCFLLLSITFFNFYLNNKILTALFIIFALFFINKTDKFDLPNNSEFTTSFLDRFRFQSYDDERFFYQNLALKESIENPIIGLSQGEFDFKYNHSVHNTWLRYIVEHGLFTGSIFLLLLFFVIYRNSSYWYILILIAAYGIVVDMNHWRILFILFGLLLNTKKHEKNSFFTS